jgi:hypothetical protein
MVKKILEIINPMFGLKCCRARISSYKSLSLGFWEKVFHNNPNLVDTYYGEWEIGSYYSAWRILQDDKILLGKTDAYDIPKMNKKLKKIKFGEIISINQLSKFDIRVEMTNNMFIDFFGTTSARDEIFHIFCPDKHLIEFFSNGRWAINWSNVPIPRRKYIS